MTTIVNTFSEIQDDFDGLHVLRLSPWRVQVIRGTDLRSRIWKSA